MEFVYIYKNVDENVFLKNTNLLSKILKVIFELLH